MTGQQTTVLIATVSPLLYLVLKIRLNKFEPENLKIRQKSRAWLTTSNTVRGLGYLVQSSVTQDNIRLIVTSLVLYLVIYHFCDELWSRCTSTIGF